MKMGKLGKGTGAHPNYLSHQLTEAHRRYEERGAREAAAKPVEPCAVNQPFKPDAHVASPYERQHWRWQKKRAIEAARKRQELYLREQSKKGSKKRNRHRKVS